MRYFDLIDYIADMQILNAVNIPELKDYVDVIFFSVMSPRPDFDILSGNSITKTWIILIIIMKKGGDLDGDKYFVCWETKLVEAFEPTAPPKAKPKVKSVIDCDPLVDFSSQIPRQYEYPSP